MRNSSVQQMQLVQKQKRDIQEVRINKQTMNRYTEILVGESGTGKTAELIKRSAESGIYILVANRKRAEILVEQAKEMRLYIPFPVTLQEWLRSSTRFHGSSIRRDGLLIDDIDGVIKELFSPIEIKAVALRTPCVITNLDNPAADVVEVVRCKDCIYNHNGGCTHSEIYDDTNYSPDYYCADGERREE